MIDRLSRFAICMQRTLKRIIFLITTIEGAFTRSYSRLTKALLRIRARVAASEWSTEVERGHLQAPPSIRVMIRVVNRRDIGMIR